MAAQTQAGGDLAQGDVTPGDVPAGDVTPSDVTRRDMIQRADRPAPEGEAGTGAARDEVVIPVLHETLHVGKRRVESGRVRVHKTVSERDEPVEVVLKRQDLEVERVPIGRVVDEAPAPREEAGTLIVPVIEEVLVVEKRLMLKEELHIRRKNTEQTVRETVRLRAEAVSVEHLPAPAAPTDPAESNNRS